MKRKYSLPKLDTEPDELRRQAHARRHALRSAGLTTYQIGERDGQRAIMCLCCGLGSHNTNDVDLRYCGFCQAWHETPGQYASLVDLEAQARDLQNEIEKLARPGSDQELVKQQDIVHQAIADFALHLVLEFRTFHHHPPLDSALLLLVIHEGNECEWHYVSTEDGVLNFWGDEPETYQTARGLGWRWAELPPFLPD